ncbi:hypothetical protein [Porphyromonas endodontalis]|uniref:hypothetical protein n=1 Tax=Porphyromonas endodontalis TaxID=28124 RepID=UPI00248DDEA0|nr:hypothetical protein [Porphyromonas endodontalis]
MERQLSIGGKLAFQTWKERFPSVENYNFRKGNNRFQCKSEAGIVRLQAKEQLTPRQEQVNFSSEYS